MTAWARLSSGCRPKSWLDFEEGTNFLCLDPIGLPSCPGNHRSGLDLRSGPVAEFWRPRRPAHRHIPASCRLPGNLCGQRKERSMAPG